MIMNKLECCILSCCFLTVFITGGGAVLAHYRHFAIGRYSLATMNHLTAVAWTVVPSLLAAKHPAPSESRDVTPQIIYT